MTLSREERHSLAARVRLGEVIPTEVSEPRWIDVDYVNGVHYAHILDAQNVLVATEAPGWTVAGTGEAIPRPKNGGTMGPGVLEWLESD